MENLEYALTADAIGRALILSKLHLPKSVKTIDPHLVENGLRGPTIAYSNTTNKDGFSRGSRFGGGGEKMEIFEPRSLKMPIKGRHLSITN